MKVNDYVRTRIGKLYKIEMFDGQGNVCYMKNKYTRVIIFKDDVITSSENINDLIEVGDIIAIKYRELGFTDVVFVHQDIIEYVKEGRVIMNNKYVYFDIIGVLTKNKYEECLFRV